MYEFLRTSQIVVKDRNYASYYCTGSHRIDNSSSFRQKWWLLAISWTQNINAWAQQIKILYFFLNPHYFLPFLFWPELRRSKNSISGQERCLGKNAHNLHFSFAVNFQGGTPPSHPAKQFLESRLMLVKFVCKVTCRMCFWFSISDTNWPNTFLRSNCIMENGFIATCWKAMNLLVVRFFFSTLSMYQKFSLQSNQ